MPLSQWLRPPRRSVTAFLVMTLALAGALGWLTWRLIEQDREREPQRTQERLDRALDLSVVALRNRLGEIGRQLDALSALPPGSFPEAASTEARQFADDGVLVAFREDSVEVFPDRRLAFYPDKEIVEPPADTVFAEAEQLEFRLRDYAAAAAAYARIARESRRDRRAHAVIREAAVLRKAGRGAEALTLYDRLATTDGIVINDAPVALVAHHARCATLQELAREAELRKAAQSLDAGLAEGRWKVTRAGYSFYTEEAHRWLGQPNTIASDTDERVRIGLASAVAATWNDWQRQPRAGAPSIETQQQWIGETPFVIVGRSQGGAHLALVLGPDTFEQHVLGDVRSLAERQGVDVTLIDAEGRTASGLSPPPGAPRAVRAASEAALPWTIYTSPGTAWLPDGTASDRRRLMIGSALIVGACVLVGGYFSARAVHRELEVARLKSDFVSAVSHDFRTPLASFRQLSELLLDGRVATDVDRKEYYARLHRESGRLQRLVEDLLDFGRMDAGAREYRFLPADPESLVRQVADDFASESVGRGHRVDLDVTAPLPPLRMDAEAIGRAVWNLLDNAVKYSPGRQTVWLKAWAVNGSISMSVRDEGVGIPADRHRDIFRKFVRVTGHETAAVPGTGLGLAMVHHIVRAHGGTVHVDSVPGQGSTFTIVLPTADYS